MASGYGYILHIESEHGQETWPNVTLFDVYNEGDAFEYRGRRWVVTGVKLAPSPQDDDVQFELWARLATGQEPV